MIKVNSGIFNPVDFNKTLANPNPHPEQLEPSSWWKGRFEIKERAKDRALDPEMVERQQRVKAQRDESRGRHQA